jgi:hypothetical protein
MFFPMERLPKCRILRRIPPILSCLRHYHLCAVAHPGNEMTTGQQLPVVGARTHLCVELVRMCLVPILRRLAFTVRRAI